MNKANILGIDVDNLSMKETIQFIEQSIKKGDNIHQVAVNAYIFVLLRKDAALKESIVRANLINGDGQSVVWASRFLGAPIKERVTGIDLMEELVKLAHRQSYKIYLFGAEEYVVKNVVKIYAEKYSPSIIAGFRNGYYTTEQEEDIVKEIANSGTHFLFVAMGSPKKELFLYKYRDQLNLPYIMGVGGTFDVIAGKVNRAPIWMQRSGLEWFYRIIQEPRRMWKRYLVTNSLFIYFVILAKLKIGKSNY